MAHLRRCKALLIVAVVVVHLCIGGGVPSAIAGPAPATYGNAGPSQDGCSCDTEGIAGCAEGLCNSRGFCTSSSRQAAGCAGFDCSAYGGQSLAWTVCDNASSSGLPSCTNKGEFGYFCRTASGNVAGAWNSVGACACTLDADCATASSGAVCGLTGYCRNAITGVAVGCVATGSSSSSSSGAILSGDTGDPEDGGTPASASSSSGTGTTPIGGGGKVGR